MGLVPYVCDVWNTGCLYPVCTMSSLRSKLMKLLITLMIHLLASKKYHMVNKVKHFFYWRGSLTFTLQIIWHYPLWGGKNHLCVPFIICSCSAWEHYLKWHWPFSYIYLNIFKLNNMRINYMFFKNGINWGKLIQAKLYLELLWFCNQILIHWVKLRDLTLCPFIDRSVLHVFSFK